MEVRSIRIPVPFYELFGFAKVRVRESGHPADG
jgi:hypothetical protein